MHGITRAAFGSPFLWAKETRPEEEGEPQGVRGTFMVTYYYCHWLPRYAITHGLNIVLWYEWDSANNDLFNPLAMHTVYAPVRDHPATFPYCCSVTILEWKIGYICILPPVGKPGSPASHCSPPFIISYSV